MKNKANVPSYIALDGYAMYDYDIQHVEGKIMAIIESAGMSLTQENAIKGLTRSAIYELYKCQQVAGEYLNEAIQKTTTSGTGWESGRISSPLN